MLTRSNPKFDFIEHILYVCVRLYINLSMCVCTMEIFALFAKIWHISLTNFATVCCCCYCLANFICNVVSRVQICWVSHPRSHTYMHMSCVCVCICVYLRTYALRIWSGEYFCRMLLFFGWFGTSFITWKTKYIHGHTCHQQTHTLHISLHRHRHHHFYTMICV